MLAIGVIMLILTSCNTALAGINDFSAIKKKSLKPQTRHKASISHRKGGRNSYRRPEKIDSAVLWHAPPYRPMAEKLSSREEQLRDLSAMGILLEAASQNYPQLEKARKILAKKDSPFKSIIKHSFNLMLQGASEGLGDGDYFSELHSSILNKKVRNREDSIQLVNQTNKFLYKNYRVYKNKFFVNDMRNPKFIKAIEQSKSNLTLSCGEDALRQVDRLFLHRELSAKNNSNNSSKNDTKGSIARST